MSINGHGGARVDRRTFLKLAAGAGLATAGGLGFESASSAAPAVSLSLWTGYPELVPFYKAVATDYAKTHPSVAVAVFSTSLREAETKLSAAVPTGTGPDIYDIGTNITVKFIDGGLLDPNPPDIVRYMKSGAWDSSVVEFFAVGGKYYGLPLQDGSRASMFYNKTMLKEAGIAAPPSTYPALIDAARKLTKFDSTGKMTRSGVSLRLSGQGSGIAEKFRFVLEPAGGSLIVKTKSGKYHNNYDNAAGRAALQFYVDAVQKYKIDDPKIPHDADAFVAETTAILFREAWVIGEIQQKNPKLDYGVVPIPRWRAGGPYKMLLQPWGIYVNGKSSNKSASWDFLKFLTSPQNAVRLTSMTGWVSERRDVDWKPLLAQTPQFAVFVSPPKGVVFYVEPVLSAWDEIETKLADRLTDAYVDPSLNNNPAKVAATIHTMAEETDSILKTAGLYGMA
ncbi:MAG TPA: extracellular solute-binding protein [bacterium]|nr:extracellular solute-binding protein [bacterium]